MLWWTMLACAPAVDRRPYEEPPPVDVPDDAPFVRYRVQSGGFCSDPDISCLHFRELWGEGTVRWKFGDANQVFETGVDASDVERMAVHVLDPAAIAFLELGSGPCASYTDASRSMALAWDGRELQRSVLGCDVPQPLLDAEDALGAWVAAAP